MSMYSNSFSIACRRLCECVYVCLHVECNQSQKGYELYLAAPPEDTRSARVVKNTPRGLYADLRLASGPENRPVTSSVNTTPPSVNSRTSLTETNNGSSLWVLGRLVISCISVFIFMRLLVLFCGNSLIKAHIFPPRHSTQSHSYFMAAAACHAISSPLSLSLSHLSLLLVFSLSLTRLSLYISLRSLSLSLSLSLN